jgi:hypothetical protein
MRDFRGKLFALLATIGSASLLAPTFAGELPGPVIAPVKLAIQ